MGAASAQQARVIVNNALKLYSQDKTGMVDFALESGGECLIPRSRAGAGAWESTRRPEGERHSRRSPGVCWRRASSPGARAVGVRGQMTRGSRTPELLILHLQSYVL